jgi:hypothetical protein
MFGDTGYLTRSMRREYDAAILGLVLADKSLTDGVE